MFDWSQDFVNAELELPTETSQRLHGVKWSDYKVSALSYTFIAIITPSIDYLTSSEQCT